MSKFLDLIQKQRNKKKKEKFKGTFIEYLEMIKDNPDKIKLAHKRLYETICSHGVETVDVDVYATPIGNTGTGGIDIKYNISRQPSQDTTKSARSRYIGSRSSKRTSNFSLTSIEACKSGLESSCCSRAHKD